MSEQCETHPEGRTVGTCLECGKPVCSECLKLHGYFCSEKCKAQRQAALPKPSREETEERRQQDERDAKVDALLPWVARRIPLALLLIVVGYVTLRFMDKTGKPQWTFESPGSSGIVAVETGPDAVYGLTEDGACVAVAWRDGSRKWSADTGGEMWGYGGIARRDGNVFVYAEDRLAAIDPDSGKLRWKRAWEGSSRSQQLEPAFAANGIFAAGIDEGRRSPRGDAMADGELTAEDVLALIAERRGPAVLSWLDPRSGRTRWTVKYEERVCAEIAAAADLCFVASHIPGELAWRPCAAHPGRAPEGGGACYDCGYEREPDRGAMIKAYDAGSGEEAWTRGVSPGAVRELAVVGGRIGVLTEANLYSFDLDGRRLWSRPLPMALQYAHIEDENAVLIASDRRILALDPRTGKTLWKREMPREIADLTVADGLVFIRTREERQREPLPGEKKPAAPEEESEATAEEDDLAGACRLPGMRLTTALSTCDLRTGKERWQRDKMEGGLVRVHDGVLLVHQPFGFALLSTEGPPTYFTGYSEKRGKERWRHEHPSGVYLLDADGDRVCFASGSQLVALHGRGWINRLTK